MYSRTVALHYKIKLGYVFVKREHSHATGYVSTQKTLKIVEFAFGVHLKESIAKDKTEAKQHM